MCVNSKILQFIKQINALARAPNVHTCQSALDQNWECGKLVFTSICLLMSLRVKKSIHLYTHISLSPTDYVIIRAKLRNVQNANEEHKATPNDCANVALIIRLYWRNEAIKIGTQKRERERTRKENQTFVCHEWTNTSSCDHLQSIWVDLINNNNNNFIHVSNGQHENINEDEIFRCDGDESI